MTNLRIFTAENTGELGDLGLELGHSAQFGFNAMSSRKILTLPFISTNRPLCLSALPSAAANLRNSTRSLAATDGKVLMHGVKQLDINKSYEVA